MFSWDYIPGNDNRKLIEFLKRKYDVNWIETANIEKIDDDRAIKISTEKNSILIKLNDEKTEVNLKFDDGRTDKFVARIESNELNIYPKTKGTTKLDIEEFDAKAKSEQIDKRVDELRNRLLELESFKERQAEFIFQSVSITIGLFTIVLTILIGFFIPLNLGQYSENIIIALLLYIAGIVSIWYIDSKKKTRKEKRKMDGNA